MNYEINWDDLESKELVKGFHAKIVHMKNMTIILFDIEQGSVLPEHHHVHEQTSSVLRGELKLNIDGTTVVGKPGNVIVIPSNVSHSAVAITDCQVIDVFSPIREDYL